MLMTFVSGATGATLTRDGTGTLTLTNDNSGFTGSIRDNNNSGSIVIKNAKALGDSAVPTIIGSGSSLRIDTVGNINETLILNGGGVSNLGALINDAGNNTHTPVELADAIARVPAVRAGTARDRVGLAAIPNA